MTTSKPAKRASRAKTKKAEPPWEHESPKGGKPAQHLPPAAKAAAKRRARKAGRRYPNLVDNMWAAKVAKK